MANVQCFNYYAPFLYIFKNVRLFCTVFLCGHIILHKKDSLSFNQNKGGSQIFYVGNVFSPLVFNLFIFTLRIFFPDY